MDLEKSFRAQRNLTRDLSNSALLLDMTVHEGSDGDFGPISRSRSSSKATPPVDRAKLKATKHATDRRATVSNGVTSAADSGDETKPRLHPRTKSLPSRPANNYYETIDEVRKNALQPVKEGDGDESKSRSLPTLVDDGPVPPKSSRRAAKSCRDKHERRSKKHKKRSRDRKDARNSAKTKDIKMSQIKESNENTYENSSLKVQKTDGHLYDKLGRDSHTHPDQMCDACVVNVIQKRSERLSLNVANRGHSYAKNEFSRRPRSFSQGQSITEKEEWTPSGLTVTDQNKKVKDDVSTELNNKLNDEERPYFTLEPLGLPENCVNDPSSSELSDDVIAGSLDALQEQIIISKNHTDSFKRIVSNEQKANRPDFSTMDSDAYETYEIGVHAETLNKPQNDLCKPVDDSPADKKVDDFADRTYQTLEPPQHINDTASPVIKNRKSEETFF